MNSKEGISSNEYGLWQAHARQIQAEAIADQIVGGLEAELYIGIPVADSTASVILKGISGEQISIDEVIGRYGEEPSEVLNLIGVIARKNGLYYHASKLREYCSEEIQGHREWNLRTSMDLFWELMTRFIGGHRNEPILESAQNGWVKGTNEFLSAIEGEVPLLEYSKILLQSLPVNVQKSVVGEEMFYLETKIPNVSVKYWYSTGQDRPNMGVVVKPFS